MLTTESKLQLFFKFTLIALLRLLVFGKLLANCFFIGGCKSRCFTILTILISLFVFGSNLVGADLLLFFLLFLLDCDLFSNGHKSINWNPECFVQLNLHLLGGADTLLRLNDSRVIISIGVGRQDSFTIPLDFVVFFLASPRVFIAVLLVVSSLISLCHFYHFPFDLGFNLLTILIIFNFNLPDLLSILGIDNFVVFLSVVTVFVVQVSEPHLFVFNEVIDSAEDQCLTDLILVFNFFFVKFADLVVCVLPVHELIEIFIHVSLQFLGWHSLVLCSFHLVEKSDHFKAVFFGGRIFRSHTRHLRSHIVINKAYVFVCEILVVIIVVQVFRALFFVLFSI